MRRLPALLLLGAGALAACTVETPTNIGGPLVPGGDVVTFEVILSPDQYLEFDTAFAGYITPFETNIKLVARDFEGVLDANTLLRFTALPTTLQVRDAAGTVRTDSTPRFPTGYLMLRIDSARSRGTGKLGVYRIGEAWDPATTTWTTRIDTGTVTRTWTTPGGTLGAAVGSVDWQPGGADSLMIPLDSTQIIALTNQTDSTRGALITLEQAGANGAMLHVSAASIRISAKSTVRPDTTIALSAEILTSAFVSTPDPPNVHSAARVSGVPAWRSVLGVRLLGDLIVPCPGVNCTVRLKDAHINLAELLLEPTASPPGFSPEDSLRVTARALLESSTVPLSRSPVSDPPIGVSRIAIPRSRFTAGDTGAPVGLPITNLVAAIVTDTATNPVDRAPRRIALLTNPEAASFGFGSFKPGPRLRLVLTISREQ